LRPARLLLVLDLEEGLTLFHQPEFLAGALFNTLATGLQFQHLAFQGVVTPLQFLVDARLLADRFDSIFDLRNDRFILQIDLRISGFEFFKNVSVTSRRH